MSQLIRREALPASPVFNFADLERQGRDLVERARAEAARITAQAEARARTLVEQNHRAGFDEGLADGRRAGLEQVQREARQAAHEQARREAATELAHVRAALTQALTDFDQRKHALLAGAESGLLELAIAIARRVCRTLVTASSEPARATARALLELVGVQGDVELRLSPADHAALPDLLADLTRDLGTLRHVHVIADEQVARGGAVVATRDGTIRADVEAQLDRIAAAIVAASSDHPAAPDGVVP